MAKVSTKIRCKCGFGNKVIFSRPNPTSKHTGRVTCSACLSQIGYEVTQGDEGNINGTTCQIKTQYLAMSPELAAMLLQEHEEEEKLKAAEANPDALADPITDDNQNLQQPEQAAD